MQALATGLASNLLWVRCPLKKNVPSPKNLVGLPQEQMTDKMTEAMITSNRAMEIAAKKELALEETQYNTHLAQGNIVFDLIHAERSPEAAQ